MHKVLGLVSLLLLLPSLGFSQIQGNVTTFFANRRVDNKTISAFLKAVREEDYKLVNKYLTQNPTLANVSDKDGNTALMHASSHRHLALMKLLTQKGAKVNTTNDEGDSALCKYLGDDHWAWSPYGQSSNPLPAVMHLLNRNAHVNISCGGELVIGSYTSDRGWTPLHAAIMHAHPQLVNTLIAHGANVNAKTESGRTPFDILFRVSSYRSKRLQVSKEVYEQLIYSLLKAGVKIDEEKKAKAAQAVLYNSDDNFKAALKSTGLVTDKDLVKYKIK